MTQEEAHIKHLSRELYEFCKEREIPMLLMVQLPELIHSTTWAPKDSRSDPGISDAMFAVLQVECLCRKAALYLQRVDR